MSTVPLTSPRRFSLHAAQVDLDLRQVCCRGRTQPLTPLEVDLLAYLAARAGRPVARRDIEHDVWGMAAVVQSSAVAVAIRRLRAKLEADAGSPCSLTTVRGFGWSLHLGDRPTGVPSSNRAQGLADGRAQTARQVAQAVLAWANGDDGAATTLLQDEAARDDGASQRLLSWLAERLEATERRDRSGTLPCPA